LEGQGSNEPQEDRTPGEPAKCDHLSRLRREAEDQLSQRLFSIILAVHAAQNSADENPGLLPAILTLIKAESAASLEDVRHLAALR
jgi:hypothetical protein